VDSYIVKQIYILQCVKATLGNESVKKMFLFEIISYWENALWKINVKCWFFRLKKTLIQNQGLKTLLFFVSIFKFFVLFRFVLFLFQTLLFFFVSFSFVSQVVSFRFVSWFYFVSDFFPFFPFLFCSSNPAHNQHVTGKTFASIWVWKNLKLPKKTVSENI
jgi:hypothetical protein